MERWKEHFEDILNRPPPLDPPEIEPHEEELQIRTGPPSKAEIRKAIASLKNGKAAGPDFIPARKEARKEAGELSVRGRQRQVNCLSKCYNPSLREFGRKRRFPKTGKKVPSSRKIINMVKVFYANFQAQVLHEGDLTAPFNMTTGVRQGSPEPTTLHNCTCLDHGGNYKRGKDRDTVDFTEHVSAVRRWRPPSRSIVEQSEPRSCSVALCQARRPELEHKPSQALTYLRLDDLDFADDLVLLSHSIHQMRDKTKKLEQNSSTVGLGVNAKKTKGMRVKTTGNAKPVCCRGEELETVKRRSQLAVRAFCPYVFVVATSARFFLQT
ncbi:hypothetical protein Bbelb_064780 [Branchiostoma belcheri]|nr:hypothetical protein Bbelb_064780 [Branchiostoma belcheri]